MNVRELVTTDYPEVSSEARLAKVAAVFGDPSRRAVVVTRDGNYEGVITSRQLVGSHRDPDQTAGAIVRPAPRISPEEDVREAAQLMVDGAVRLLPVFENQALAGVVTANDLLRAVRDPLRAATVGDAYTSEIVTIDQETTLGDALHEFREQRITHLPVVDAGELVGVLSLTDLVDLVAREVHTQQGGDPGDPGRPGGGAAATGQTHGGYGARAGELERMLDLPVRDEMSTPARTARPPETLDAVVAELLEASASSLVVTDGDRIPQGIVTRTDLLDVLTWEATGHQAVQINGTEYLDDMTFEDVVDVVEHLERINGDIDFHDVRFHVSKHRERRRGTPQLYVRGRLSTDRGLIVASAEGFGAQHAFNELEDVLRRRLREEKTFAQSKKPPGEEFWEKRFGWFLSE